MPRPFVRHSHAQVALVDPMLCESLSKEQTVAMALTALSACLDALLAHELSSTDSSPIREANPLLELSIRGIEAVGAGLPRALESKDLEARELLSTASIWAGRLSAATPAPPTQVRAGQGAIK